MEFLRISIVWLAIAAMLLSPLAGAVAACHGDAGAVSAAVAHMDHGMSSHQHADRDDAAGQHCSCCEKCSAVCVVSPVAPMAVAARPVDIELLPVGNVRRGSTSGHVNPSPPSPFKPPIPLA